MLIDDCRNPLIISSAPDEVAKERFVTAHRVRGAPLRQAAARQKTATFHSVQMDAAAAQRRALRGFAVSLTLCSRFGLMTMCIGAAVSLSNKHAPLELA